MYEIYYYDQRLIKKELSKIYDLALVGDIKESITTRTASVSLANVVRTYGHTNTKAVTQYV